MKKDELPKYRDKRVRQFVAGIRVRDFQSFERQLQKRLTILESAQSQDDLRLLSSNHFEALMGDSKCQFSIRIIDQWRICFEWSVREQCAFNIEVADYHR
jgi:toxin HigB-1